tara:strand:- start:3437 stop:4462 length:1026 start_codon:yes stop_codon:yes gene_type:complete
MAVDTSFFQSSELQMGVGIDNTNVGTASSAIKAIETESVSLPTFNDYKLERRGGASSGVLTEPADLFIHKPGGIIEFSANGFMTDELQTILLPNALGTAYSTNTITVAKDNYKTNTTFHQHDTAGADKTLTFAFNSLGLGSNDCITVPGCVITSLTLNWDANDDAGRIKFDLTAQSRVPADFAASATIAAYDTDYCYGTAYNDNWQLAGVDAFFKSWSLAIENPVTYMGGSDSAATIVDGEPQTYIRSIPNLGITFQSVVKYDATLDHLWNKMRTSGASGTVSPGFLLQESTGTPTHLISAEDCSIEEMSYDEGDFLGLNTTMKVRDGASAHSFKYVWPQS